MLLKRVSQETPVLESLQAWSVIKRDSNIGVSSEVLEIFKNNYFEKHLEKTAFVYIFEKLRIVV